MKKSVLTLIVFISFVLFMSSCFTPSLTNQRQEIKTFGIDFRKYTDKGFLFMPDEYFGEYEVKGMITAELHPEVKYITEEPSEIESGKQLEFKFVAGSKYYTKIVAIPDNEELIDHIYNQSVEWGGDAFTHFKNSIEVAMTDANPNTSYTYYKISGIVIKRK